MRLPREVLPAERLPFSSREFKVEHASESWTLLCPADHDDVLDSIPQTGPVSDRDLPYWAEHWPSAQILLPYLLQAGINPDTRICELGAGLGVLSSVLSSRFRFVVATDIATASCSFAYANMTRSGGIPRVVCADWSHPPFKPVFDLVIASDVLYEKYLVDPVLQAILALLKPGGAAFVADPSRKAWEMFKNSAAQRMSSSRIVTTGTANDGKTRIEVLEIRL